MNSYIELANYYDIMMDDVHYEKWVEYLLTIFEQKGIKPKNILDCACGTGNITIPLSQKGFKLFGVDMSMEMLAIAENKARMSRQKINFFNQDMTKLQINESFDCILCMCDGVNYLIEDEQLQSFLSQVNYHLKENGIFIFDISSYNKLCHILGNQFYYEEKNNIYYIWDNTFDEKSNTVEMDITFFAPQGSLYKKFEENHIQKAYTIEYLMNTLEKQGFMNIQAYEALTFEKPNEQSERIFFVANKK